MIAVSRRTLWIALVVAMALLAAGLVRAEIRVDLAGSALALAALVVGLSLPLWPGAKTLRQQRLSEALELMALFSLVSAMGALASYAVAAGGMGYADARLAAIDRAMGFDWIWMYQVIAARPWLSVIAQAAYLSIFLTPVAVMFALGLTGQAARGRRFLAAFGLALAVALLSFHFFPARSALAHHLGTQVAYLPATGIAHLEVIESVRAGTLAPVDLARLAGIITFPSFHAAAAVLFMWAAWTVRALRWPVIVVNLMMLVATPVEGTHYLIDVIGGITLAVLVLALLHLPGLWPALGSGVRLRPLHARQ